MTSTGVGDKLDARVASVAERVVRRITRRDALQRGVLGGAVGLAAFAIGERPAMAATCDCGPTYRCDHWGNGCPPNGCPTDGFVLCKNDGSYCSCRGGGKNSQGYCCEYSSGYWVACSGLCKGHGYKLCYDCKRSSCYYWCTCLSETLCCGCTTPEDARREQAVSQAAALN